MFTAVNLFRILQMYKLALSVYNINFIFTAEYLYARYTWLTYFIIIFFYKSKLTINNTKYNNSGSRYNYSLNFTYKYINLIWNGLEIK